MHCEESARLTRLQSGVMTKPVPVCRKDCIYRVLESFRCGTIALAIILPEPGTEIGCCCMLPAQIEYAEKRQGMPVFGIIVIGLCCKLADHPQDIIMPNGWTYMISLDNVDATREMFLEPILTPALVNLILPLACRLKLHQKTKLRCMYVAYVHEKDFQDRNSTLLLSILGVKPGSKCSKWMLEKLAANYTDGEVGDGKMDVRKDFITTCMTILEK